MQNRVKSKNAIIIIGNGFDKAHNLPTSYGEFADYYLKNVILERLYNYDKDDKFFNQHFIADLRNNPLPIFERLEKGFNRNEDDDDFEFLKNNPKAITFILKNEFLAKLYNDQYNNWFDIEAAYFSELQLAIIQDERYKSKNEILILNNNFEEIKRYVKEYLINIKEPENDFYIDNFFRYNFLGKEKNYVLNFNYTNTFNTYKESFERTLNGTQNTPIVNHIHSDLKSDILFGYGDSTSDGYQSIKDKDIDEYMDHLKTLYYLRKSKYRELINELEIYSDYEVYVFGHSLGRTDKTLLKKVLEREKCLNIHLFKRQGKNEIEQKKSFDALIKNILRIFDNEDDVRSKVLDFESSITFPYNKQPNSHEIEKRENSLYKSKKTQ